MHGTGSGKTATFLVPILERLKEHSTRVGVRAVVLSPTRELAMQTAKFLKAMAKYTTLRYTLLVGGDSMEMQVRERRALVRRSLAFEQSRHPPCRLRMFL